MTSSQRAVHHVGRLGDGAGWIKPNFRFHSVSYEWLVISGARAQYKGVGTVNGAGAYGFLLTATDGR